LYQSALIFATLLAVAFARIEDTQKLDGSKAEIMDDVLDPNPFRGSQTVAFKMIQYFTSSFLKCKDGSDSIFKRSVLEGGLDFEIISRERRQAQTCPPGQVWDSSWQRCRKLFSCPHDLC